MKKLLTILALLTAGLGTNAQNAATPNPGFENWVTVGSYQNPSNWNNLNASTAILGVYTCTKATGVDKYAGASAIKLTTKSVFGITANGIASTATLITTAPYGVTGGIPYTERPDSIVGWYKNTPVSGDTAFCEFILQDSISGSRIGYATFNSNTTHITYSRFSVPITYYSTAIPNQSYWILSASGRVNKSVNSTLFVDDLDLVFKPKLTVTPLKLYGFTATVGGISANKSFTVSGTYLKDSVTIKAPAKYQVSFSATSGFKTTIKAAKNGSNALPNTKVYIRYMPTAVGTDSGSVNITSPSAVKKTVKLGGSATLRLASSTTINSSDVQMFPNPTSGSFNIYGLNSNAGEQVSIVVYDLLGNELLSKKYSDKNELANSSVEIGDLLNGVYLCKIMYSDVTLIKRIVKN